MLTPPETTTVDPDRRRRCYHFEVFLLACLVIVAALLLQVRSNDEGEYTEQVAIGGASRAVLPPLCLTYAWFGIKCPGCGLTRAFIHLAQGDFWASFQIHRLGWLVALATLVQLPYRLHEIYRPGKIQGLLVFARWFGRALLALLILNWVFDLFLRP